VVLKGSWSFDRWSWSLVWSLDLLMLWWWWVVRTIQHSFASTNLFGKGRHRKRWQGFKTPNNHIFHQFNNTSSRCVVYIKCGLIEWGVAFFGSCGPLGSYRRVRTGVALVNRGLKKCSFMPMKKRKSPDN
jgi:hypothetical protein